jgi:hypothetical protein
MTSTSSPPRTERDVTWTALASGSTSVARSSETLGEIGTTASAGTTKRSANPPLKSRPTSRPFAQTFVRPARHASHSPHARIGFSTTRVPTSEGSTPSPTSATAPTDSCPMISGGIRRGLASRNPCRSEPQIAEAVVRTTTSPAAGVGSSTSCSSMRRGPR